MSGLTRQAQDSNRKSSFSTHSTADTDSVRSDDCVVVVVTWSIHPSPGTPLYEFAHGLSFTNFTLRCENTSSARWPLPSSSCADDDARSNEATPSEAAVAAVAAVQRSEYSCEVTNTGTMDGDEVVFLFHRPKDSPAAVAAHAASSSGGDDNSDASVAPQHWALPKKALIDWKRVTVPAGKTISVPFTVDASMLALRGAEGPAVATFHSGDCLFGTILY
jgi:hypothetical protein